MRCVSNLPGSFGDFLEVNGLVKHIGYHEAHSRAEKKLVSFIVAYFKAVTSKVILFTSVCLDINLTLSDKVDIMEGILPVN